MKEKLILIKTYLKGLTDNQKVVDDVEYFTYLTSLLPIPIYQQAAQLINKALQNRSINLLIEDLQKNIYESNESIARLENEMDKISLIDSTVASNPNLKKQANTIISQLEKEYPTEFIVNTDNWSNQRISNQIIETDYTSISAKNYSDNYLKDVEIKSNSTYLNAEDHSSNYLEGTAFKEGNDYVGMHGITQQGDIEVTSNRITLNNNSRLTFGRKI